MPTGSHAMSQGKCSLCQKFGVLRRTHIVPKAFTKRMFGDNQKPPLSVTRGEENTKRMPGGVYEEGLLCAECEQCYGDYDNAAVQAFAERYDEWIPQRNPSGGQLLGWKLEGAMPERINRFGLSLWIRAHLASIKQCEQVDLGGRFEAARRAADPEIDFDYRAFPMVLVRFVQSRPYPGLEFSMTNPGPSRIGRNKLRAYSLNISGFRLIQIVDSQRIQPFSDWILVGANPTLFALAVPYDSQMGLGHAREIMAAALKAST